MNHFTKACLMGSTILSFALTAQNAQATDIHSHHHHDSTSLSIHNHNTNAPMSVMGDHTHTKGEWMVSYRFKRMSMNGNLKGNNSISPEEIVTSVQNPNAPPATLRVVPTKMDMDMHMLGGMYGMTDRLTVMAMAMYMKNEMEHITFQGMMGTTELGRFTTRSSGWGDMSISGIYQAYQDNQHTLNLSLGLSIPTGSIKEADNVLTPMNTTPRLRLPYAMQLGSGTWDALPGVTYTGHQGDWSWGAQYSATLRLEDENSQNYRLGHKHALTGWGGYKASDEVGITGFFRADQQGKVKGRDSAIAAPVQTANPENYGGEALALGAGFTYAPSLPTLKGVEFAAEIEAPVYQDVNGVQMDRDYTLSFGLSYRF